MQDIDNHMDDLFRRASDGYPLKAPSDGWDKIAPMLGEPAAPTIPQKTTHFKKYGLFAIFLLAFFLLGVLTRPYIWKKQAAVTGSSKLPVLPVNDAGKKNQALQTVTDLDIAAQPGNISKSMDVYNRSRLLLRSFKAKVNILITTPGAEAAAAETTDVPEINQSITGQVELEVNPATVKSAFEYTDAVKPVLNEKKPFATVYTDSTSSISEDKQVKKTAASKTKNQLRGKLYVGALAGISLNRVKNQQLQKPGYEIGFKAGYQLTKQLSIETGLLYEQKYYYTSGEYFNAAKIAGNMPVGMAILSLKGTCSMFELPIAFKYNLPGKNPGRHFYTTAGLSTYLLSREYNQYKTIVNGTANDMTGIYNNQSASSAASVNVSVGIEKAIGKSTWLRVEPYLQFPIKGLGVGAVPVTTAGIHLGIFRFKN